MQEPYEPDLYQHSQVETMSFGTASVGEAGRFMVFDDHGLGRTS